MTFAVKFKSYGVSFKPTIFLVLNASGGIVNIYEGSPSYMGTEEGAADRASSANIGNIMKPNC